MSYEGYVRKLCANGHLSHYNVFDDDDELCPHCNAPFVWRRDVDTTNGLSVEEWHVVDPPLEIIEDAEGTAPPRYKIPEEK